jgi:flagellin
MPVGIVYNPSAVSAKANLSASSAASQSSIQRLSSGGKITRASDDVAGLAVGTQLQSSVTVLKAAANNTQQANALLAVADGALDNIGQMLQRMSSLASQATSASLTDASRAYLNQEYLGLMDEIDRIASNTKFNGTSLIDGSFGTATTFDNAVNGGVVNLDDEITTHNLDLTKLYVVQSADNETAVLDMSGAGDLTFTVTAVLGDFQGLRIIQGTGGDNANTISTSTWEMQAGGRLYVARDVRDDLPAGNTTFTEVDPASGAAAATIVMATANALDLTSQVDANRLSDAINYAMKGRVGFQVGTTGADKVSIGIIDSSSGALGIHQTRIDSVGTASVETNDMVTPNIAQVTGFGASEAVDRLSKAIESVLSNRAAIGAYTSRFDKAFNAITTSLQNQDAARSVYLDADVAEESSNLAASQVKMNASISVLAQANEMNRSLLKLVS